jgi:formylglycine-generating enzyme required for sulfatase activity
LEEMGWYDENSGRKTHEVGQKRANGWGLHDMHGNVFEWCAGGYGDYPRGSVTDPEGTGNGSGRVTRGGCWLFSAWYCRSAYRDGSPGIRNNGLGFRVAVRVSAEKIAAEKAAAERAAPEKAAAEKAAAEKAAAEKAAAMIGRIAGQEREIGGIRMVWCPPGRFVMGSPPNESSRSEDERQHEVTLTSGYWLAKYECTQEEWERMMGSNPSRRQGSSRPVEDVSWNYVQEWMEEMKERHPLPEGWEWSERVGFA